MFLGYYANHPGEEENPWDGCPPEYYEAEEIEEGRESA